MSYEDKVRQEIERKYGDCWKTKDPLPFWAYLMLRYGKTSLPCCDGAHKWGFWCKEGFLDMNSPLGKRSYLEKANLKYNKEE